MSESRKPYPSDVSDDEWALVAPYLTLLPENVGQRSYPLREVFNGLRYIVKTGAPWRWMPNDLPPWEIVYQQAQRWLRAGCFEALAEDLRALLCSALRFSDCATARALPLVKTPFSRLRAWLSRVTLPDQRFFPGADFFFALRVLVAMAR